jgi:hypothetical protein
VLLQFGSAYDDVLNKYAAAFLRDLSSLSPEHQTLWKMREASVPTKLHPDYYRASILGEWPERASIYEPFVEELRVVNAMANAMGRPPFFRQDFTDKPRPREFASLLRPTAKDFETFVHLLDKLMSDNINKKFFRSDIPDHDRVEHEDGSFERQPRGTIQMLERWLSEGFIPKEKGPISEIFSTFREVRRLRQAPAHKTGVDVFDQAFIHRQRELIGKAYAAVRTLRLVLANHPAAKRVDVPEWLFKGEIWSR